MIVWDGEKIQFKGYTLELLVIDVGDTKRWFIQKQIDYQHAQRALHREGGPAVIYSDGRCEWWYDGKLIPVSNQEDFERWLRNKAFW